MRINYDQSSEKITLNLFGSTKNSELIENIPNRNQIVDFKDTLISQ